MKDKFYGKLKLLKAMSFQMFFNKNQFENFHVYKVTSLKLRAGLCLLFHIDDLGNQFLARKDSHIG